MTNLHTHTTFSDGVDTIGETVKAAVEKGFLSIGISDHSAAPQNLFPGVMRHSFTAYLAEINAAAEKYGERIEVYAGIENEYCHPLPTAGLDYVIGSIHYFPHGDTYLCADSTPDEFEQLSREAFGGDYLKLARRYFEMTADMALSQKPDIIGHFDIITKFNRHNKYFDTHCGAYMDAVMTALDAVAQAGCVIEVNTGGMSRGYVKQPYPEWHILDEIQKMGIPITLSSDSHGSDTLDFDFTVTAQRLKDMGFASARVLAGGRFEDRDLNIYTKRNGL